MHRLGGVPPFPRPCPSSIHSLLTPLLLSKVGVPEKRHQEVRSERGRTMTMEDAAASVPRQIELNLEEARASPANVQPGDCPPTEEVAISGERQPSVPPPEDPPPVENVAVAINDNDGAMTEDPFFADDFEWESDPYRASPFSKYNRYELPVEHEEGDRATQIKLCSLKRPHMRGLHCAWISFFLAFTIWFAPAPLLVEIQDTLGLSKKQVWTSSITNDITAIIMRTVMGPMCDAFGARIPMAVVLVLAAIPTSMVGLVNSAVGLSVLRFFIGIAGSSFVMAQFWPSRMFAREIAGTANGIVGGWGNLGGAFTQLFMGRVFFPVFRDNVYDGDAEKSWRTICIIPACIAFVWGLILPWISDDAPMGNYSEMKHQGTMDRVFFTTALRSGAKMNTLILYIQYASSFGVELVMNNGAVLYFNSEFGLSTEDASSLAFIYGSLNLFARALGGYVTDRLNMKYGMRGRLWLQTILLFCEGVLIIVFAFANTLAGAIVTMCMFSLFTQSAEGAIYGVVPYISKLYTGSVAGIVGAGGNMGSIVYGLGFRSLSYQSAFVMMGSIVMASSFLSVFINIPCHAGLIRGQDNHAVIRAREKFRARRERAAAMEAGEQTVEEGADIEMNRQQQRPPTEANEQGAAPGAPSVASEAVQATPEASADVDVASQEGT